MPASTGLPTLDARDDFRRARRAERTARAARWIAGRRPGPLRPLREPAPRGTARLRVIPLDRVVGTVEPTAGFDARFRPASEHVRARWERVALAHRRGIALPPISVLEGPDGYYVADGRHRVSVALARGLEDIEAWVTPTLAPAPRAATAAAAPRVCPAL
jgi:hypothetical protein